MKKLILSVSAFAGLSLAAHAQGVIYFDTSSATSPGGQVFINGTLDTGTDINAELLASTSAGGTFSPVAELLLSSSNTSPDGSPGFDSSDILAAAGDISFSGKGFLTDQSGSAYVFSGAPGATEYFEIEAWTGNSASFPTASSTVATGVTAPFAEVLGASTSPIPAGLGGAPEIDLATSVVPEPSTLAMAGVGLASMLIFRRKSK